MTNNKVAFFMPPLSLILEAQQKKLGRDLTKAEVEKLAGIAPHIMMDVEDRETMYRDRGYDDLSKQNVWEDWLKYKSEKSGSNDD